MLQELVWREERQVPTVHEYLTQAAAISVQHVPGGITALVGMNAKDEVLSWSGSYPKIIEIAATMCRLMDDVAGHEVTTTHTNSDPLPPNDLINYQFMYGL